MKIALTQMNIIGEDKETNLRHGEALMRRAAQAGADLIIFPEMSFTGFSMNVEKIGEDVLDSADGVTGSAGRFVRKAVGKIKMTFQYR